MSVCTLLRTLYLYVIKNCILVSHICIVTYLVHQEKGCIGSLVDSHLKMKRDNRSNTLLHECVYIITYIIFVRNKELHISISHMYSYIPSPPGEGVYW